jgi:LacI family transcriptional regulator, repressor for deo operon, udp, cdd, tsx, nupC, and nupG
MSQPIRSGRLPFWTLGLEALTLLPRSDARRGRRVNMDTTGVRRPRRATIEDVAAAAGVSVATVSRALRGLPNVAPSTRSRVVDVAGELNYQPDPAAARLAAGRTGTITVMVPHLSSWYFSNVVAGAEAVSAEAGYDFLVVGVPTRDECVRLLDERYHLERRTDGVVLVNIPATEQQADSLRERGVSLATVGSHTAGYPSVRVDDIAVGTLAADHLVGLGHQRIGLITGQSDDPMNFEVPRLRREGFERGLHDAGLTLDPKLVESGNFGIDGGQEAMCLLLDREEPPTAVFAMSDEMAFGALMELDRRHLRAGVDVSVIGVDDHEFARVVALTTISQQVSAQGAMATRALVAAMAATESPGSSSHGSTSTTAEPLPSPVALVLRSTTGVLRSAAGRAPALHRSRT